MIPVATPRQVYPSVSALARALACTPAALYSYLDRDGAAWRLKPLNERMYAWWHWAVWEPWQARRDAEALSVAPEPS